MEEKKLYKGFEFNSIYKCSYSSFYYNQELELIICMADAQYIPIENFKAIFLSISELVDKLSVKHLLFDKRKLRTFHQPSMEWYFAIWKPAVKAKGLTNHYKILPEIEWFVQAVKAGQYEIFKKYNKDILNGIRVSYVNSVEEAIEHLSVRT